MPAIPYSTIEATFASASVKDVGELVRKLPGGNQFLPSGRTTAYTASDVTVKSDPAYKVVKLEDIAYLWYLILESTDNTVLMQAFGSLIGFLFDLNRSPFNPSVDMKDIRRSSGVYFVEAGGSDIIDGYEIEDERISVTSDVLKEIEVPELDELAAVLAMICLTAVKKVTQENLEAFNQKRLEALRAQIGEIQFVAFGPVSNILNFERLRQFGAMWNYKKHHRVALMRTLVKLTSPTLTDQQGVFKTFFMFLSGTGLGQLMVIKQALDRYKGMVVAFGHLESEWKSFLAGYARILELPADEISFCKAIKGESFVPVPSSSIQNLFGISKRLMVDEIPTYAQYGGGVVSDRDQEIIDEILATGRKAPDAALPTA